MTRKNDAYIANGFVPGINLIQTFETGRHPLGMPTVNALIENLL